MNNWIKPEIIFIDLNGTEGGTTNVAEESSHAQPS
jgi:hypothetical protein